MDRKKLHRLCGIDNLVKPTRPMHWQTVTLRFVGAESYVLGTKRCELSLTTRDGGFGLTFKDPVKFQAQQLLGRKVDQGLLHDVVIQFPAGSTVPDLSLASLSQGLYPRVLRTGDIVTVA